MDITQLLEFSVQQGASDLHLSTGQPPILRIDGDVQRIDAANLDSEKLQTMIYDIMNDEQRRGFEADLESDFSFELPGIARFRANVFMHNRRIGGVFRTIPSKILTLDDLGAPEIFKDISSFPRGLFL